MTTTAKLELATRRFAPVIYDVMNRLSENPDQMLFILAVPAAGEEATTWAPEISPHMPAYHRRVIEAFCLSFEEKGPPCPCEDCRVSRAMLIQIMLLLRHGEPTGKVN